MNTTANASNVKFPQIWVAVKAHKPENDDQLSLEVDEVVEVIEDVDENWVEIIKKTGDVVVQGIVPKMCFDL